MGAPKVTSSSNSGLSPQLASVLQPDQEHLAALMAKGADLQLQFDGEQLCPAHAVLLRMWSGTLRRALDADRPVTAAAPDTSNGASLLFAGGDSSSSSRLRIIPMPGTSKADWLNLAPFMYPVTPLPEVTWSNLEALLTLGSKYDMPAILARADKFLRANTESMDNAPGSKFFVWRWMRLTDQAGLDEACKLCADKAVALCRTVGVSPEYVVGLSGTALQHLVLRLAPVPCGQPHCPRCGCSRTFKCSYCGHSIS